MTTPPAARRRGFAGISSGATLHAAIAAGEKAGESADVVLIICDGGWKYLPTGAYSGDLDSVAQGIDGHLWA